MKHVRQMTIVAGAVLLSILLWGITGCEKEQEQVDPRCKCGIVEANPGNPGAPSFNLVVRNHCTGNTYTFITHTFKNVGEEYCAGTITW